MGTSEFRLNLAVVIGINNYQNGIPRLSTARQDAEAIAQILKAEYRYEVTLITDGTEPEASRQHLQQWLEIDLPKAVATVTPSRLLFYFAGHGIALNGDDGPQGYLIPQDARLGDVSTYLPMQQIEAALSKLACRHCLVILDCCFAGAFRWSSTRKLVPITEVIYKERYDRFIQDPAWQVITSAASDQYALDNLDLSGDRGISQHNTQHSPFAVALIDALRGAADIYPPSRAGKPAGDGVITATELYLYLRDSVEIPTDTHHQRQTPQIWCLKQHDKGEFIFLPPGHPLNLPPAPSLDELEANNPYRGLKSYDVQDSALFFGRRAVVETLCDAVSDRLFTVVLGASGSGKSSLVKAGLLPHLDGSAPIERSNYPSLKPQEHPHQCHHRAWKILTPIRPGESPLTSLNPLWQELGIAGALNEPQNSTALTAALTAWSRTHPQVKLLLVVDQLEELITLCRQESERQQFLQFLATLLEAHPQVLRLVATLRADFEPQFSSTPLDRLWQAARFVIPAMSRDELQAVIEEPAAAKVVYFESSAQRGYLVDQLIEEVAGMPGALPLLSFTLSELYLKLARRYREAETTGATVERAMTWADYDDLGGVTKSLTRRADEVYDALVKTDPAYQRTIRHVMLRMVAVGGELARRRVPESELKYPEPENTRVQTVIEQFATARLLVRGTDADNIPYIEPAHDALVRGWEKLLTWKAEQEENLILQRRLTAAAVEWEEVRTQHNHQPKGVLEKAAPVGNWVDQQLFRVETAAIQIPTQVLRWFRRSRPQTNQTREKPIQFLWDSHPYLSVLDQELQANDDWFNQTEGEFVRESVLQKRRNLSWRWRIVIGVIAGLSGLTTLALIGQRNALIGQVQASRESAVANFRAGQTLNAFLDSLRAAHSLQQPLLQVFQPDPQLEQQVQGLLQQAVFSVPERNRLGGHQGIARSMISPNGQWIASAGEDGMVAVWNWQGQKQAEWDTGQGRIANLSFSPDSQQLAVAGGNTVRLWTLQGQPLALFAGHTDMVKGLSFSPDGQLLATSGRDLTVRLWNLQGQPLAVLTGHQKDVWQVVFSPDGQMLASASDDDTFRFWNLQGSPLQAFKAEQSELHALQFSPDGQRLVTAGRDGRLRLWDLQGQPLADLPGHQGHVWSVVFSADGTRLASASSDGTVRLWSSGGQPITVLRGHQGPVRQVSFSPDGQRLVSSGDDSTVRLWTMQGQQQASLSGHQGAVAAVQFTPTGGAAALEAGSQLATAGADATIRLWNLQGQPLATLVGDLAVQSIAFSPSGQQLASAQGQTVRLWTSLNQRWLEFPEHQGLVRSVQFSPDGQQLVSAGDDDAMRLWNLQGQPLAAWRANQRRVWQVAFSPDGQRLASAGENETVQVWDLQGQLLVSFEGHLGPVYSVGFSPDGRSLVSSGQDGTIRLWDLQTNRQQKLFQVYDTAVNSVTFSPDGTYLISSDNNGDVQLWNLLIQQQVTAWSAHPKSSVRSVRFSPDGKLLATTADDGTTKLWRLEVFDELLTRGCALMNDYLNHLRENAQTLDDDDRDLCINDR
ncbi:MAG: caspase family protein [Elainella sp. C42_A2020_010]|nr:caspase family protein [Elainella sp. C42_A2020_010]